MAWYNPRSWFGSREDKNVKKLAKEIAQVIVEDQKKFNPISPPHDDNFTSLKDDLPNNLDSPGVGVEDINNFTQLAERRDLRYTVYDQMRLNDSLAAAVLEIYADDITQLDPQGRTIWAESKDTAIAEAANRILRILKIEDNIWAYAYSLVLYGDVYLELFRDEKRATIFQEESRKGLSQSDLIESVCNRLKKEYNYTEAQLIVHRTPKKYVLEDYIEKVSDPSEIFDIVYHGKTVGFVRTHVNENKQDSEKWNSIYGGWRYNLKKDDIDMYDSRKFIHIHVPDAGTRHPYKIVIDSPNKEGVAELKEHTVSTGKSLLQDAYKVSQQLQLMETSILLSRLTRASIFRLIGVQVGQKGEVEAASILHRIKSLLDKKQTIDTTSGRMSSYANPGPDVTNIVYPIKDNNQGAITYSTVGGDYDPKSLADLDYLVDKELAAFKVPKQFLNFTDGGGFNGGASLAKISAQYAHRIVRFKRAFISGFTQLINYFFDNRNPDYVGKFELKMASLSTIEDTERVAMARDKLDMVNQVMDQLDIMEDVVGKFEILKDAFEDAYPNSVVSTVISSYITKLKAQQNGEKKSESPEDSDSSGDGGSFASGGGSGGDDPFVGDPDASDDGEGSEFPTDLSGEEVDLTDTDSVDSLLGDES